MHCIALNALHRAACAISSQFPWRVKVAATRASRPVCICGRVVCLEHCRRQSESNLAAFSFMQKLSLERVRPISVARLGVFPVTLWRDATRAAFERVRGSSIGHRRLGARVSAEHTRYRIQQKETLKKHFPKKTIYFVTV